MSAMYVVQTFVQDRKGLRPETPNLVRNIDHARRMAERLAQHKAAVVAFMREGDPITGDFEDPKLIAAHGAVPEEINEMQRV